MAIKRAADADVENILRGIELYDQGNRAMGKNLPVTVETGFVLAVLTELRERRAEAPPSEDP